jgi:hypothetical protein
MLPVAANTDHTLCSKLLQLPIVREAVDWPISALKKIGFPNPFQPSHISIIMNQIRIILA